MATDGPIYVLRKLVLVIIPRAGDMPFDVEVDYAILLTRSESPLSNL
jgi:hypothetical protein